MKAPAWQGVAVQYKRAKGWPKGTDNPSAKLNPEKVREIRKLLDEKVTHLEIAKRLGVGETSIWAVANGLYWRHVV